MANCYFASSIRRRLSGRSTMRKAIILAFFLIGIVSALSQASKVNTQSAKANEQKTELPWMQAAIAKSERDLVTKYGEGQHARVQRGLHQVAEFWTTQDG